MTSVSTFECVFIFLPKDTFFVSNDTMFYFFIVPDGTFYVSKDSFECVFIFVPEGTFYVSNDTFFRAHFIYQMTLFYCTRWHLLCMHLKERTSLYNGSHTTTESFFGLSFN